MPDHYAVLGVRPDASAAEIRQAWIRAARRWHPDQRIEEDSAGTSKSQTEAQRMMRVVNEAWRVLGDAQLRASYDHDYRRAQRSQVAGTGSGSSSGSSSGRATPASSPGGVNPDTEIFEPGAPPEEPMFVVRSRAAALVVRALPWLLLATVVITIFIVTAYASGSDDPPVGDEPICVRFFNTGTVRYVPCSSENDGVLDEIVSVSPGVVCSNPDAVPYEVAAIRRLCILPPSG